MRFRRLIISIIITIFIVLPLESYALSPVLSFRRLFEQTDVSPSPSPGSGGSNIQQSCSSRAFRSCQMNNITACLAYSQNEICLFVHNNGEDTQHMKVMILPPKNAIMELNITSHQTKKVKFSLDADLSSAIVLTTRDGDCVVTTAAAPPPENHYQKHSSYVTYITPINGAYLVILLLITGGILTYFKLRTHGRHLEGVAYHELELGNSAVLNMEDNETENWDQDWNDEWDEEKPEKSVGDNHVLVKKVNDLTTKLPNSNGRKKEWDD